MSGVEGDLEGYSVDEHDVGVVWCLVHILRSGAYSKGNHWRGTPLVRRRLFDEGHRRMSGSTSHDDVTNRDLLPWYTKLPTSTAVSMRAREAVSWFECDTAKQT